MKQNNLTLIVLVFLAQPAWAINIVFDYTYGGGFFSGTNEWRRAHLEAAAAVYEERLVSSLPAINPNPGIGNTWSMSVPRPDTGVVTNFENLAIPADTLQIFAGAKDLGPNIGGEGYHQFSFSASTGDWFNLWSSRNSATVYTPPGGSLIFNTQSNFYFDPDISTLEPLAGLLDFHSLVLHELGHVLGFFFGNVSGIYRSNDTWVGPNALALTGGVPIPLIPGEGHVVDGFSFMGEPSVMDPYFLGERIGVTELDWAILADMGWDVAPIPEPSTAYLVGLMVLFGLLRRRKSG